MHVDTLTPERLLNPVDPVIEQRPKAWRSRWAAIGAAVAVTLGAGGLYTVRAAGTPSVFVPIAPARVLDTRIDAGLSGPFTSDQQRLLDVTGTIPVVQTGDVIANDAPVPDGVTGIVANVTVVGPSTPGYLSVRPGNATGEPTTTNVNFTTAGAIVPNSVTVEVPTSGEGIGAIALWFHGTDPTATTHVLVDIVGYYQSGGVGTPGPQGATGPEGPAGATGTTGATGPRGLSSWDTIPSGQTLIGEIIFDSHSPGNGVSDELLVPFGAVAPAAPTSVKFAPHFLAAGAYADSTCTGTGPNPTAPPGKVCLYIFSQGGLASVQAKIGYLQTRGFRVSIFPSGLENVDMFMYASWAYTAP
ncbi:MAG TPA: hypothetical protein VMM60_06160 [Ilumatobacter sp.]|nr:hypothetical protein [Ilumatobacter sp.]